jgi:hypothetical protein
MNQELDDILCVPDEYMENVFYPFSNKVRPHACEVVTLYSYILTRQRNCAIESDMREELFLPDFWL